MDHTHRTSCFCHSAVSAVHVLLFQYLGHRMTNLHFMLLCLFRANIARNVLLMFSNIRIVHISLQNAPKGYPCGINICSKTLLTFPDHFHVFMCWYVYSCSTYQWLMQLFCTNHLCYWQYLSWIYFDCDTSHSSYG